MCSRFSFVATQEEIESKFDITLQNPLRTSYNIGPTQHAYIITNDNQNRLQYVTWGLIPSWSETGRNTGRLINARKENIGGQTSFRIPIRKKRCFLLPNHKRSGCLKWTLPKPSICYRHHRMIPYICIGFLKKLMN